MLFRIKHPKGIIIVPAAEDRQAKALESMERSARELNKIMAALNENFVKMFAYLKDAIERDEARTKASEESLKTNLDEHKDREDRDERAEYEYRTGETLAEDGVKVLTPTDWMNYLKRWWNYESIGNMDAIKMTRQEFFAYMSRTNSTEVTNQIPEHIRNAVTDVP